MVHIFKSDLNVINLSHASKHPVPHFLVIKIRTQGSGLLFLTVHNTYTPG
jgi:hypothetical protein